MKNILVVDDEPKIVTVLTAYLEQAGFRVVTAGDGEMALRMFRHEKPDLVILDLMLPGMDGLDVCRIMRRESDAPVIMLTARAEEADKLIGLELGADDYVTKPFSPREVVARVRTVLRRVGGEVSLSEVIQIGDLEINLAGHTVEVAGRPVKLTATEFDTLAVLARHPNRALTRLQLLDQVQGDEYEGYDRTVDAHIKNLRAKIELDPKHPRYIVTVYGVGYKLEETHDAG